MATDIKAIARGYFQQIDSDGAQTMPSVFAEHFVATVAGMPPMNREAFQGFGQVFYGAFPGLRHSVDDQIAEGNTVVNRLTVRGTHTAPFQGIPPTGRSIEVAAIATQRYEGEQMVEQHLIFDAMGLMQQLGVIPEPNAAAV